MLVERGVMEQRFEAVMAVVRDGQPVTEVPARFGGTSGVAPEQMVILQDDPAEARRIARLYLARYLAQPNYQNSLRRLGFTDDDFQGEGTDRVIDALVAWGDEDAILKRVQAHRDAGADHVCVQPLADPAQGFPIASIRRLSEALLAT